MHPKCPVSLAILESAYFRLCWLKFINNSLLNTQVLTTDPPTVLSTHAVDLLLNVNTSYV